MRTLLVLAAAALLGLCTWLVLRGGATGAASGTDARSTERRQAPAERGAAGGAGSAPGSQASRAPVAASWSSVAPIGSLRVVVRYRATELPADRVPVRLAGPTAHELTTDLDGVALAERLAAGRWTVSVPLGRGAKDVDVSADARAEVELLIDRAVTVLGVVVDELGNPVADAEILVQMPYAGTVEARARSDAAGAFTFRDIAWNCRFAARANGRHSWFETRRPDADRVARYRLVLDQRGAVLAGVVQGEGGRPLPEALVTLVRESRDNARIAARALDGTILLELFATHAHTDAAGRFSMPGVVATPAKLLVEARAHVPSVEPVEPKAGDRLDKTITLSAGAVLLGSVRDREGKPVPSARLFAWQELPRARTVPTAVADLLGRYRCDTLSAGPHEVTVEADGCEPLTETVTAATEVATRHEFVLTRLPVLAGIVVDPARAPIAGVSVRASVAEPKPRTRSTRSGPDGRFELPVDAGREWQLALSEGGPDTVMLDGVPVPSGTKDLELVLPDRRRARARLLGAIVDPAGKPVTDAMIMVRDEKRQVDTMQVDPADASFQTSRLPPGSYFIESWSPRADLARARLGPFELVANEQRDLGRLVLPQPGFLVAHVRRSDDAAIASLVGTIFDAGGRDRGSLDRHADPKKGQPMQPGEYRLAVSGDGLLDEKVSDGRGFPFTIKAGETTSLEAVVEPAERRDVRYPASPPEGWAKLTRVKARIERIGDARVVHEESFSPADEPQPTRRPALAVGAYRLLLECSDQRRFEGRFEIEALEKRGTVLTVAVRELR